MPTVEDRARRGPAGSARARIPAIRIIAAYTLLEALRNRMLWLIGAFVAAGFSLALFLAEVAITDTQAVQSGFAGALLRVCAVFVVSLFVITSVVRELNDKGLELLLSLPVPRASYFTGKLLGFCVLGLLTAATCALALLPFAPASQVLLWCLSLAMELALVVAASLLCLFTFSQVTPALGAVLAFYLLSRSMAAFQLMASSPLLYGQSAPQRLVRHLVDGLAYVLPDLHRFTTSEWLIHHTGAWEQLLPVAVQTGIYLLLLSAAALFDLYRKEL